MADNDPYRMQAIKNTLRSCYYGLHYFRKGLLAVEEGSDEIADMLVSTKPFMICRLGSNESRIVHQWMHRRHYSKRNINHIMLCAGVFPNDQESIDKFCEYYTDAIKSTDAILTWGCVGESDVIHKYAPKRVRLMRNDTYNVMFYNNPWSYALKGKRVLVVHPFVDTIASQYERRLKLFSSELLPEFSDLLFVKAIQSNAGECADLQYKSWFEALEVMKQAICNKQFDVALIGAGAYGIPLAAHVKSIGKQAIHMAGNLQILFGIRGKRWDNYPQYAYYFNEFWVYPSDEETPKRRDMVEGGSYWK